MNRLARRLLPLLLVAAPPLAPTLASPLAAQRIPRLAVEKYTLPNGLEVLLHEDRSTPMVAINTLFKVGSGDETPGRTGFAHLFEHVMFMGSEHVPTGQFDQLLEAAGAQNNGSTTEDRTDYNEEMPSNALPLALWLDSDRMGFLLPTMDQPKLDLQRDVVKNERRERVENVPYGRAFEAILETLYPAAHPYHWPIVGSMADLSAAALEDVKGFFRTYYAPNNAALAVAGDFDRDSVKAWIAKYYADVPRGPALPARPTVPTVELARDTFIVQEDRVQLPRAFWTWHGGPIFAPDDAPLDLLAYVLGGDKNSRLYKRLVYDLQVAQDVEVANSSSKLDGFFVIDVTPKPGHTVEEMQRLVLEEVVKLQRDGITPRELERARNTTLARMIDRVASVQGKAAMLNMYNYFVGTPDYIQQDAARYERATAADVQRVANTYLSRPKVVLTVVPQGKTAMALKAGVP